MQEILIAYITIVILSSALLYVLVIPKAVEYIKRSKKRRETQEVTRIKKIVNDYLNELQRDE